MPDLKRTLLAADTPRLVLDRSRLAANIRNMQARAEAAGVALRPHIKTHKCVEIAIMQLEAGAAGVTTAKVDEALVFIKAGIPSLTLAYPLLRAKKLDRLLKAAKKRSTGMRFVADSEAGVKALSAAAKRRTMELRVLLKIDVGLHRCGVAPDSADAVELAKLIASTPGLRFTGILSHAGQVYSATNAAEAEAVAQEEAHCMALAKERIEATGLPVREVSVGATPTVLATKDFGPATEIRPGNYVFLDSTCVRLGLAQYRDVALTVLASVVSKNDTYCILDCGSKTLSSDMGAHGGSNGHGFGQAWSLDDRDMAGQPLVVEKLSEEHGFLRRDPDSGWDPDLGERVRIVPNHSCPVANLAVKYLVLNEKGKSRKWSVAARALVR